MSKSPALTTRLKSFAAKLSGNIADGVDRATGNNVVVDNANTPSSAASMMKRKMANTSVSGGRASMGNNQKTFGVPGAK